MWLDTVMHLEIFQSAQMCNQFVGRRLIGVTNHQNISVKIVILWYFICSIDTGKHCILFICLFLDPIIQVNDGFQQDCSNSSVLAMELRQSCAKSSIYIRSNEGIYYVHMHQVGVILVFDDVLVTKQNCKGISNRYNTWNRLVFARRICFDKQSNFV